ncbi:dihydrolipoyl dehydrogenase [Marinibaculum pumilum]|uniref:Dihydrolipoyl dehydrogenase n=1 Tax=Marinibaculum pumilum TaxID=1766165 RepID=A0ABV7L0Z2_9PROT
MAEDSYDLIVIGGGPGGYTAAIRAAQLGMKTACVESRATLGGTCLNVGCIPSKALLESSEIFHEAAGGLSDHGVKTGKVSLDLGAMMGRKDKVVGDLTKGIEFLFKKHKITWLKGHGALKGGGKVEVTKGDGAGTYSAKQIILVPGSEVTPLPGVEIDEDRIVSSTGALALPKVPKHLVVVGGGYIGLEMGTVWKRLGAEVTVVEFLDRILPGMDGEVSKQMQRLLSRQGMNFKLSTKVTGAKVKKTGVTLTVEPSKGGEAESIDADYVLVAIGRRPYTKGLGLEEAGVELDDRGRIKTDAQFATTADGIYAIGDAIVGPMLAHKAEEEGVACTEMLAGQKPHINYDAIPGVVYTWPEVATVGRTEEQLKADGVEYRSGKFPFSANARAKAVATTDGFVKMLADAKTDAVLGCHIIGPDAGTLIAEVALAIEFGASAEDIARTCHAHPTLNEAVKEAALAVDGRTLNI